MEVHSMRIIKVEKDYRSKSVKIFAPTLGIAYKIKRDIEKEEKIWKRFLVITNRTIKYI